MSACLPVIVDGDQGRHLGGVACSDFPIEEMIEDIQKNLQGQMTYAFLVDRSGNTFVHPSMPVHNRTDPLVVHITSLERDDEVQNYIQAVLEYVDQDF